MKKVFKITLILLFLVPFLANAEADPANEYELLWGEEEDQRTVEIHYDGIVPCGRCLTSPTTPLPQSGLEGIHNCEENEIYVPCDLCHLFIIFDHIISFILTTIIPGVALLVIVFSGVMMIAGSASPDKTRKAKSALFWAIAGTLLAFFSWAIVTVVVASFMDWDIQWTVGGIEVNHMCEVQIKERTYDQ